MKKALALITYSRFEYFLQVWNSIKSQRLEGASIFDVYDIHVFHDGVWAFDTPENIQGHLRIEQFLDGEKAKLKRHRQGRNLGIALHYDYAEKHLFLEKNYDFVVFCEDDLLLSDQFMSVLDKLANRFADDPRVGMLSAHPATPATPLEEQYANQESYALMGHNWGFGLSRAFWLRRQPLVEHYLEIVRGVPYRSRPHHKINNWLQRIGFQPAATSQDYIKSCATRALGAVKLATFANFGTPIGKVGVHSTDTLFEAMGLQNSVLFDGRLASISPLTDCDYQRLLTASGHQVGARRIPVLGNAAIHNPNAWEARLASGEFAPEHFDLETPLRRTELCPCGSGKRFKHCCGR